MKHFNKFKDQLRPENTQLPEGMGWDDMEEGILNKMGEGSIISNSSFFGNKMFIASLAMLICTVSIFFMYMHVKNSEPASLSNIIESKKEEINSDFNNSELFVAENNSHKNNSDDNSTNEGNLSDNSTLNLAALETQNQSTKSLTTQDLEIENTSKNKGNLESKFEIENGEVIEKLPESTLESFTKKMTKAKAVTSNLEIHTDSKFNIQQSKTYQNSNVLIIDESIKHNFSESNSSHVNGRSQITEYNNLTNGKEIESKRNSNGVKECIALTILTPSVSSSINGHQLKELEIDLDPIIKPAGKRLWKIELSSGWNTWNYGLNSVDNYRNLYQNTHSEYGFSHSVRLDRKINDRVSITSGVDLDFLYKKIEVSFKNYKNKELKNTLLSYSLNAISGQKANQVYGDTIVVDTIIKSLTDYNKFQVIQIPLIINYEIFSNPSWRLEAGVGPSISMLINYNGKYLENDVLHSYSKIENIYSTSPKIALNANIRLSRNLGRSYYMGIRADFRNHFSSWSSQSEGAIKPKILSGLITLGKSF